MRRKTFFTLVVIFLVVILMSGICSIGPGLAEAQKVKPSEGGNRGENQGYAQYRNTLGFRYGDSEGGTYQSSGGYHPLFQNGVFYYGWGDAQRALAGSPWFTNPDTFPGGPSWFWTDPQQAGAGPWWWQAYNGFDVSAMAPVWYLNTSAESFGPAWYLSGSGGPWWWNALLAPEEAPTDHEGEGEEAGLSLKLTDSANEDYKAIWVTISGIEVVKEGEDSKTVHSENVSLPITVDLLSLQNGLSTPLGLFNLEPGHYTQIRLHLGDMMGAIIGHDRANSDYPPQYANCVYENGTCHELTVPSGYQTGIKLNWSFDIQPDTRYELMLDFDARESVHMTGSGSYRMRPTVRVIEVDLTGVIAGSSEPGATIMAQVENTDECGNINIVQTTTADEEGNYKLSYLEPGIYTIIALKEEFQPAVKAQVQVIAGFINDEQNLPLTPGDSFCSVSGLVDNLPPEDQEPQVKAITSINDIPVILDLSPLTEGSPSYTLNVPPGDYTFSFCADNQQPVEEIRTVEAGTNTVSTSF